MHGVLAHPSVLWAISPVYAFRYLVSSPGAFLVLGGVFLCVTGAEALYADMGHFGTKPIRIAWSGLVFPTLILSYAGQAALVLSGTNISDNIFFRTLPATTAHTHGIACHYSDDHRQPVHHHRRILYDQTSHPAGLDATHENRADVGTRLWADLCRTRQLDIDDRNDLLGGMVRQIRTISPQPMALPYPQPC